jgi:hypothetical protein
MSREVVSSVLIQLLYIPGTEGGLCFGLNMDRYCQAGIVLNHDETM